MEDQPKNIKLAFLEAIEKDTFEDRNKYLDQIFRKNPDWKAEMESLLKTHDEAGDFLESPIFDSSVTIDDSPVSEGPGTVIDRYKLLEKIGEGGMAVVYMAEQTEPIRRKVALKIIKLGMDTKSVIVRFEAERQALAMMDHPNIAKVLDAGSTETGRPYFVMELVTGVSITEYCDRNNLSTKDRLVLFIQVCNAVQHAHQKGIIHRDIKPTNVMVSRHEGQPIPKVIDFGIAKATDQRLTEKTLFTHYAHIIGTPAYMSPEQADLGDTDVDTRSDIYSLGVLLYELLTGTTPFSEEELRKAGYLEMQRVIREQEPPKPSTKLSTFGETITDIAKFRACTPDLLTKAIRGDLDLIVMKSLEKERVRRYDTVAELSADIGRHLRHEPVLVTAPAMLYKLHKFVSRNKALVTGISAVLIVLIAGIIVSTLFALGQTRARKEAEHQTKIAQAISDYLRRDLIWSANPFRINPEGLTAYSYLDAASVDLENKFADEPQVEAFIRRWVGTTYRNVSRYAEAEPHLERSVQLFRKELGDDHPETLQSMHLLVMLYRHQSRYVDAEDLAIKVFECRHRILGQDDINTLWSMNMVALVYRDQGLYKKAEPFFLEQLDISQRLQGKQATRANLLFKSNLASLYRLQGRYEEAEPLLLESLDKGPQAWGDKHPYVPLVSLGLLYIEQGRYAEAEPLLTKAVAYRVEVMGENHLSTLTAKALLASLYRFQKRYEEAETLATKVLEARRLVLGAEHHDTLSSMYELAKLYIDLGRYGQAEPLLIGSMDISRRTLGEEHPLTLSSMNALGILYNKQKLYQQSEPLLTQALSQRQQKFGEEHPATLESMNDLALFYKNTGRFEDAERLFLAAFEGRRLKLKERHPDTKETIKNLSELYEAWAKPQKAKKWKSKLPGQEE